MLFAMFLSSLFRANYHSIIYVILGKGLLRLMWERLPRSTNFTRQRGLSHSIGRSSSFNLDFLTELTTSQDRHALFRI